MPSYADWVSTSALVLSLGNIGWQVRRDTLNRPNLHAKLGFWLGFDHRGPLDQKPTFTARLTVTNYGASPVTITDASIVRQSEAGYYSISALLRDDADPHFAKLAKGGPQVPFRLQGHDQAEWVVTEGFMRRFGSDEHVRGVITFVEPPRFTAWRWTPRETRIMTEWTKLSFDNEGRRRSADAAEESLPEQES